MSDKVNDMVPGPKNLEDLLREKIQTWEKYNINSEVIEPEMEVAPDTMAKELAEVVETFLVAEIKREIHNSLFKRRS